MDCILAHSPVLASGHWQWTHDWFVWIVDCRLNQAIKNQRVPWVSMHFYNESFSVSQMNMFRPIQSIKMMKQTKPLLCMYYARPLNTLNRTLSRMMSGRNQNNQNLSKTMKLPALWITVHQIVIWTKYFRCFKNDDINWDKRGPQTYSVHYNYNSATRETMFKYFFS